MAKIIRIRDNSDQMPYADVLYPAGLIKIMSAVINGRYGGYNPEHDMDTVLASWLQKNVINPAQYARDVAKAVLAKQCLPTVLDRLNFEILLEPDPGDKITICRGKIGLPGANLEYDPLTESLYGLPLRYQDERTTVIRKPRKAFSDETKHQIIRLLKRFGTYTPDVRTASSRLEKSLKINDLERSILARIAYLILFERLTNVDSRSFEDAILPMERARLNDERSRT